MSSSNGQLMAYIAEDLKENKGVMFPVRAGLLERMFVRKARTDRLHPNPDDEFCDPSIGPKEEIITDYANMILRYKTLRPDGGDDPLMVEKVHPDGYMILNGHHRWAAAMRVGFEPVPISIVNLTHEADIKTMLRNSSCDRRVTLDLDEVIFCTDDEVPAEKKLSFPFSRMYKERIRRGSPAVMNFLSKMGYDIWVYTAQYYSYDYLRAFFRHYSVKLNGIVTGTARKTGNRGGVLKKTEKLLEGRYRETLHIDTSMVLRTFRGSREMEEYPIEAGPAEWSQAVISTVHDLNTAGSN